MSLRRTLRIGLIVTAAGLFAVGMSSTAAMASPLTASSVKAAATTSINGHQLIDLAPNQDPQEMATRVNPLSVGTCTSTTTYGAPGGRVVIIPTTTSGGSRDCRMNQGNVSPAVSRLQSELNYGCNTPDNGSLVVDGNFGAATKARLKVAQSASRLTADGIYGTATASAFNWLTTDGQACVHMGI